MPNGKDSQLYLTSLYLLLLLSGVLLKSCGIVRAGQAVLGSERAMKRLRLDNKNTVKDILSFFNDTAREMERERKEATTTDTYGWI